MKQNYTFNDHFGIDQSTEYLNIPLDQDLKAFICPFNIVNTRHDSISGSVYYRNKSFLEKLNREYIKPNKVKDGLVLLSNLHESNEYHLGYSGVNKGKGIGSDKATHIFASLRNNKFVSQGISVTNESQNVLLLVKGIGQDNMSDIISNVCRDIFADFTYSQCLKHNIPTSEFEINYYNSDVGYWDSKKKNLPTYNSKPIILIPKNIATGEREFTSRYNWFIAKNNISFDIINGTLKVSDFGKYVKTLSNGDRKAMVKYVFEDFKKPKEELIEFVIQYGDMTLVDFQDYIKENFPDSFE
ncbi:hypothetical protein GGR32_002081 [Mesonia hippocampi]|uniref:Uncharacterized protein n=1 Tax=Mesonia hippocampi TaxID=1628250 RepID=A0A840ERU6_9FLAO|nr:hypothetical protein [Mesonia hippocampi]MBB4119775.1 hypothetical protein [Mesonia hippocampi]